MFGGGRCGTCEGVEGQATGDFEECGVGAGFGVNARATTMCAVEEELELPSFYELLRRFSLFDTSACSGCDVQVSRSRLPFAP